MSIKVFVEYKVITDKEMKYLESIPLLKNRLESLGAWDVQVYQAIDQGSLYVEEYCVSEMEDYEESKKLRLSREDPFFREINRCIVDEKVNIWPFAKLSQV